MRDDVSARRAGLLSGQHMRTCDIPHIADEGRSLERCALCNALHILSPSVLLIGRGHRRRLKAAHGHHCCIGRSMACGRLSHRCSPREVGGGALTFKNPTLVPSAREDSTGPSTKFGRIVTRSRPCCFALFQASCSARTCRASLCCLWQMMLEASAA